MQTESIVKLNRTFDPVMMQRDLDGARLIIGTPAGYPGEGHRAWTSLALFNAVDKVAAASRALLAMPYFRRILDDLACPVYLARLMALAPAGVIAAHRDPFLGFDSGLLRLHVPVITNPDTDLSIDGQRCDWKEGELWYGDFSRPHWGANRGAVTRVHLVIDVSITEATLKLFPRRFVETLAPRCDQLLDAHEAAEYEFEFLLPAGFRLPGMNPLFEDVTGRVVGFAGVLFATLNDQPFLRLMPVDGRTLRVIGLPVSAELTLGRSDGHISSASLTLHAETTLSVPLQVLGWNMTESTAA